MTDEPATRAHFAFFHRLRVRYVEVDAQAVVYNSHYLTYYDIGITEYLRQFHFNQVEYAARTGKDFHLIKATVEYLQPLRYDEEFDVAIRVARAGTSSMTLAGALFRAHETQALSRAEIVWVYADQGSAQAERIPDTLRRQFSL